MDLAAGLDTARRRHEGVLVTLRGDGRPQLSNILYALDGSEARISVTDSRAKTRNLRRDRRASLYVPGDSFWTYLVLDGTAELSPVASAPGDAVVDELVELYRTIKGEDHPDWDEYRSVMADEGRLVVRLRLERAYGMA
ncbi:MAG: PPOX class F420-dependent oxidoreductase [Acidimicrobiales bacterium]